MRLHPHFRTLAFQIYLGIACVLAILAVLFGLALTMLEQRQQSFLLDTVELVVDNIVTVYEFAIANQLFVQNRDALELTIHDMLHAEGIIGAGIFQADGTLLVGSEPALANLGAGELRRIDKPYQIIRRDWNHSPVLEYTRPILIIGELQGYVRAYYNLTPIQDQQRLTVVWGFALFSVLFAALFLMIRQLLNRLVIGPVSQLTAAMQTFESGSIGTQVAIASQNEIGGLAQAFNQMSHENARMYGALHDLNKTLEQKVHDRTRDLEQEIFERRQVEKALRQAKEAAESANRTKSTFLAGMSHELRTPLHAILGFSQIMAHNPDFPPAEQSNLDTIRRSGNHLLTLINQVLDLSKIEAGRVTLNERPFDLYGLLDDLNGMFSLKARQKQVRLSFDCSPDVPRYICADDVKLRQVLINLLGNALKFTHDGDVVVRITEGEKRDTNVNGATSDLRTLICEIGDTGVGIAPEEVALLFEAFAQTASGRQLQEGTGLGLPISRKFVQLMGGDIRVTSHVGQGTVFQFDVQVSIVEGEEPEPFRPKSRAVAIAPGQAQRRVLIVDDKQDNRTLLVKLLQPFGFELREATNGQEGVTIWKEWGPHLVWMDLRMPVMAGYEATRQIRSQPKGDKTVIIAVSANSLEGAQALALSKGCDDFLRKPFREGDVFDLLRKHLGVQFVYENEKAEEAFSSQEKPRLQNVDDLSSALAALPAELSSQLERAAIVCDIDVLGRVITDIRCHDDSLAEALISCAEGFEYTRIVAAIRESNKLRISQST